MVRQLLTVTRLESGALRPGPRSSRSAPGPAGVGGAGARGVAFESTTESQGWLAVADADQLDQVLWALLDNAVKYGAGRP